jgi:hypothetical protein
MRESVESTVNSSYPVHVQQPVQSFEKRVIEDAKELLLECGLGCTIRSLRDMFSQPKFHSSVAVADRLYFMPDYIEAALRANNEPPVYPDKHSFGIGGGATYARMGGEDLPVDTKLYKDHLDLIIGAAADHSPSLIIDPLAYSEGQKRAPHEKMQIEIMRHHAPDAHLMVRAITPQGIEECVKEYERTGNISTIHTIMQSPLTIVGNGDSTTVDGLYEAIENNIPVCLTSHPIMGWTGAASLYGIVVQATAEYLGGLSIAHGIQLDRGTEHDGLVAINGAFPALWNPYQLRAAYGAPATNIANLLTARVAKALGGRSCQGGCLISGEHTPKNGETDREAAEGHDYFTRHNGFDTLRGGGLSNQLLCVDGDKVRRDLVSAKRHAEHPLAHARLYSSVPEECIEQDILGYMIDLIRDGRTFEHQNHTQANMDKLLAMPYQNF